MYFTWFLSVLFAIARMLPFGIGTIEYQSLYSASLNLHSYIVFPCLEIRCLWELATRHLSRPSRAAQFQWSEISPGIGSKVEFE
jgi:cytochrome b561